MSINITKVNYRRRNIKKEKEKINKIL